MTKAKAVKHSVVITAPKLTSAWVSACNTTNKTDIEIDGAIVILAKAVKESALSFADAKKVIRESGSTSTIILESHIEGLTTWLVMRNDPKFKALAISAQLSQATASYKLLGKDLAQSGKAFEVIKKATADARKVKVAKAKESPKASAPKAKATNIEVITEMINYIIGLDFTKLSVMEIDLVAELGFTIESKADAINEVWEGIKIEN
jgi:hypothetical protein